MENKFSLGLHRESHERGPQGMWHCSREKDAGGSDLAATLVEHWLYHVPGGGPLS